MPYRQERKRQTVEDLVAPSSHAHLHPKLRPVDPKWVEVEGASRLWLRDPLALAGDGRAVLVPAPLVPLLADCDGTHDLAALSRAFARRTGVPLSPEQVERVVAALDEALLLEGPRALAALRRVREAYRAQPSRPPALAGSSYPAGATDLDRLLTGFGPAWDAAVQDVDATLAPPDTLARGVGPSQMTPMRPIVVASGVLSPHIDYTRGGPLYAATWAAAQAAVASAEVVVVFGTDHSGSGGRLTATRLPYATPWGALPLDGVVVDALERAMGTEGTFGEELHHRREHAVELAAVWLHRALRLAGRDDDLPPVVPVLCGSFGPFVGEGCPVPEAEPALDRALDALAATLSGRRTLVVSAADLAHVGPAFGDAEPLSSRAKRDLARDDARIVAPALAGRAGAFLDALRVTRDGTRVCGLPPTYWTLRLLERLNDAPVPGRLTGYQQCPADADFGSVVSIAGVLWEPAP